MVLKILGLDICADTIVGDNMVRGVSGGQRKRVTTGAGLLMSCFGGRPGLWHSCLVHAAGHMLHVSCQP